MEDTQRSQPISTESQGIVERAACTSGQVTEGPQSGEGMPLLVAESSLEMIRVLAMRHPDLVFTSVAHRIDLHLLKKSFRKVRRSKAAGVDKVTAEDYAENLDQNLYNLYQRLRRGQYVATPVERIWIDKEGGKKRPIGITALEDKIVQKAVVSLLEATSMTLTFTTFPMRIERVTVSIPYRTTEGCSFPASRRSCTPLWVSEATRLRKMAA